MHCLVSAIIIIWSEIGSTPQQIKKKLSIMTNNDVIGLIPDLLRILHEDSDNFLKNQCPFFTDSTPIISMLPSRMQDSMNEDEDMPPNEEDVESEDKSMENIDEDDMRFGDGFDFMDIEFDSDEDSDDEDSDTSILQLIINHIFNDEGKLIMSQTQDTSTPQNLLSEQCANLMRMQKS